MDPDEYTIATLDEAFVYKIPPRNAATGPKAADWPKEHVWVGKLVVVSKGGNIAIKLVGAADGKIFAIAPVRKDGPPAAEKVSDSSRYFVLRIENDKGSSAFVGLGFNSRSDAFDFNAALQDASKEMDAATKAEDEASEPPIDFSLKAGEKIRIKIGGSGGGGGGGGGDGGAAAAGASGAAGGGIAKLRAPGAAAAAPASADVLGLASALGGASLGGARAAPAAAAPAAKAPPAAAASTWETF